MKFINKPTATFLILLVCHCIADGQALDVFTNFLINGFSNFGRWTAENGKDPLALERIIDLAADTPNIQFNASVWNQFMHGLSTFGIESSRIDGDLLAGRFSFEISVHNFTVNGKYEINGTVFSTTPIEGKGNFYSTEDGTIYMASTGFRNLRVINDYIDMSEVQRNAPNHLSFYTSLEFEGLNAGGYESQVSEMLYANYRQALNSQWMKDVLLDLLQKYFTELFEETPVSEIIGTTLEPPTTTTTTTTEDPCRTNGASSTTHSETVLERNISVDENGKVITREIVLRIKEEF